MKVSRVIVMPARRAFAVVLASVLMITAAVSVPALAARDSDGDGMPNTYEKTHRLNPNKDDGNADADRDGLSNLQEFRKKTDPRNPDTDKDRWTDGAEVDRKTNPLNAFDPCPFTGLKAPSRTSKVGRTAVGVMVDNTETSRPQAGLEDADVVIEHPIEGGQTRFVPIYGCKKPTSVGPVRSARFDSTQIMRPYTKALAYSGANSIVQSHLMIKGIVATTEATTPTAFTRSSAPAPNNLFVDTPKAQSMAIAGRPFRFGKPQSGAAAAMVSINFGGTSTVSWLASGKKWLRFENAVPSVGASGDRLAADNVLIQVVEVNNSTKLFDTAGNPSPNFAFPGGGVAHLFRNGKVTTGTWTQVRGKPVFKTASGQVFSLAVGRTWVEIVPSQEGDVKGTVTF